jgi:hypothetical protein
VAFTLNLKPEMEAGLLAQAHMAGLSVEDYLQRIGEEKVSPTNSPHRLSAEEWARQFEEWADSFPEAPLIPDEALSRENLYPDRW